MRVTAASRGQAPRGNASVVPRTRPRAELGTRGVGSVLGAHLHTTTGLRERIPPRLRLTIESLYSQPRLFSNLSRAVSTVVQTTRPNQCVPGQVVPCSPMPVFTCVNQVAAYQVCSQPASVCLVDHVLHGICPNVMTLGRQRRAVAFHIGFYDVARSQNSVAGLSQKPPRSRFLPPPQAFLAHFARFVPILCAVKQIQEAQSANRNHILLL